MNDYQKQAEDFLKAHDLEFRSVLVGDDCPKFCEDREKENATQRQTKYRVGVYPRKTHIHGKHYRCTISGKERGHVVYDFWNSYSDEEFNALRRGAPKKTASAYDLLACITKSDPGNFRDFCSDFGYDTDSRKAFDGNYVFYSPVYKISSFSS